MTSSAIQNGAATFSLLLGLLGAVCGCDGGNASVKVTACTTDDECDGARCHEGRFCVQSPAARSDVVLRIQPPATSGLVLEQFTSTIGGPNHDQSRKWDLTPPAIIHGIVSRGLLAASVPGTLVAIRPGAIDGTQLSYSTTSFTKRNYVVSSPTDDGGTEERSYGFQLGVQPGHAYDVHFWPQIDEIPPYFTKRFVGGAADVWQIDLPEEEQLVEVTGQIVAGKSAPVDCSGTTSGPTCGDSCTGVAGLKVRLTDAKGRLRSTQAVTDAKGQFTIHADPAGEKVWLRFRPADAGNTLPYGTLAKAIDLHALQETGDTQHQLGKLHLGQLPAMVQARPQVVDASGQPMAGARATLRRDWPSPHVCVGQGGSRKPVAALLDLYFERTGLTNAAGHMVIKQHVKDDKGRQEVIYQSLMQLPEGEAVASVVAPSLVGSGSWRKKIEFVASDKEDLTLPACPHRPQARGAVTDFRGLVVASPTVLFKPLMGTKPKCVGKQAEMFPRPEAPVVVQAMDGGDYDVFLDPGRYAVLVEPPQGSGLARALIRVIDVCPLASGATGDKSTAMVVDLTVPPPSLLVGRIHGPSGVPVAGAVIDVLAGGLNKLKPPKGAPLPEPGQQPNIAQLVVDTQVIGSAVTDSKGAYEILVAAGQLTPNP